VYVYKILPYPVNLKQEGQNPFGASFLSGLDEAAPLRSDTHSTIRIVKDFLREGNKLTITSAPTTQRDGQLQCAVEKY